MIYVGGEGNAQQQYGRSHRRTRRQCIRHSVSKVQSTRAGIEAREAHSASGRTVGGSRALNDLG